MILTRSLRDEQFEQLIVRLLCVMMGAYPVYKNADSPNLQNFENERLISMNLKKFLTLENAATLASIAGGFALIEALKEKPGPDVNHGSCGGSRSGELNVTELNRRNRYL